MQDFRQMVELAHSIRAYVAKNGPTLAMSQGKMLDDSKVEASQDWVKNAS